MAFSRGTVNHQAAAGGNPHLLAALKKMTTDIAELQKRSGATAVDFDRRTPVGKLPGLAGISVRPQSGGFTVSIVNPQYVAGSPGATEQRNPLRAPVLHRLTFSLNPAFDGIADLRSYGPSAQTHWTIADLPASNRWVRLESSFDGENWNSPTVVGPYTATAALGATLKTVDTSAGSYSEALPSASSEGAEIVYKKISSDANVFTVTGGAEGPKTLTAQYATITFKATGGQWWVI